MTRLFLAAGVAALAIATPLAAKPGGGHGGGGDHGNGNGGGGAVVQGGGDHGNGGGHGGGGGGEAAFARGQGHGNGGGGFAAPQAQRVERQQSRGFERQQARGLERQQSRGFERQQARGLERQQVRGFERQQARAFEHQHDFERQQAPAFERNRGFERQQARAMERNHGFERQQAKAFERQNRFEQAQNRSFERQQLRAGRQIQQQVFAQQRLEAQRLAEGRREFVDREAFVRNQQVAQQIWNDPRYVALNYGVQQPYLPVTQVEQFVGVPVSALAGYAALSPFPATVQYLYPNTPDYYYQYGNGYAYQINRSTSLIDALIPLLAGGYLPGQYLPRSYMASYVPNYYGLDSFYPDYGNTCNRYANGVVYEVNCATGMVEDVIPLYASGYGVGQILPTSYAYYNVPNQYRTMYYNTPDYNYWYAPGAIYQYDPQSSLITSVAALLSPGFSVGQPLPAGYGVYNVPYGYRQTYYDTPDAWYRYNNGYIYQVDPTTQLVTAIVASLLT